MLGFDRYLVSIGWGSGLEPNRQQAVTSTNDDPIH